MDSHLSLSQIMQRREECMQAALEARERARSALEEAEAFEAFGRDLEADIEIASVLTDAPAPDVPVHDTLTGWERLSRKIGSH